MLINRNKMKPTISLPSNLEDDKDVEGLAMQRMTLQPKPSLTIGAPPRGGQLQNPADRVNVPAAPKPAAPPPAASNQLRTQQEAERAAVDKQFQAQKAQSVQQADARAGLMGLGLAGATAPLLSDVASKADRDRTLALAQLDKGNRSELDQLVDTERRRAREDEDQNDRISARERQAKDDTFKDVQRRAAIYELEDESGEDYNGDGFIGAPATSSAPKDQAQQRASDRRRKADVSDYIQTNISDNGTFDYSWLDKDTPAGTMQEPFNLSAAEKADLEELGVKLEPVQAQDGWGQPITLYRDSVTGTFFYMG